MTVHIIVTSYELPQTLEQDASLEISPCTSPNRSARTSPAKAVPPRNRASLSPVPPSSRSPSRPVSWEDTLSLLSKQLNTICKVPANGRPSTAPTSPRPMSPSSPDKKVAVSHLQSEEKLAEKLSSIVYGSPRRGSLTPEIQASPQLSRRPARRRKSLGKFQFRATIEIGQCTIEDLCVLVDNHVLKVTTKRTDSCGDLPSSVEVPKEVNPEKLICVVKNGVLEIKESKKRAPAAKATQSECMELRRTRSYDPQKRRSYNPANLSAAEQSPIVLEAEDSQHLKLVLQIPPGFTMDDIHLKTVDDHLIVSALRQKEVDNHDLQDCSHLCSENEIPDKLFQVFELPERVDPYSIQAELTDRNQLVIHAALNA